MQLVAEKLAKELGPSHQILSAYVIKQTPQRTMPLLQLIELYISIKGEQTFIENYLDEEALYQGFLNRVSRNDGLIKIYHNYTLLATGQI